MPEIDKDILATLTEEEQEAFAPDADAADTAALQAVAEGAADDDGEDDDADDGPADPALPDPLPAAAAPAAAAPAAPAAAPTPAPVADTAAAPAPAAAAEPEVDAAPAPRAAFVLPDDFKERVDTVKTAKAELGARHKAGDVSTEEYQAELDKLNDDMRALDRIETRAQVAADMHQQQLDDARTKVANSVMTDAKKAGLDYSADGEKFAELQATVQALRGIPSHFKKGFEHVLREADRRVRLAHGIGAAASAAAPAPAPTKTAAQIKAEAAAARRPDLSGANQSLAHVPGGGADGLSDVTGGEFEDVMSLEGEAYEMAIEQLAKDPRRWARFQASQH